MKLIAAALIARHKVDEDVCDADLERGVPMRAIYRWRIEPGQEKAFAEAWAQATKTIRSKMHGARGSMLLRSRRDPAEFIATARWDSFEDWQAFMQADPADPGAFRVMSAAGQMLSAEVFDEVEDLLDHER